ncbi:MAG: hypothetical protein AAGK93_00520 [Pseudomonadota bacterium]
MNDIVPVDADYDVIETPDSATLATLQSAEIDQQIATARRFPRSIKAFRDQAQELATLDEQTAAECMYSLPRGGKKITGPSVRLAEIVASCWGNCRYAARIVEEQKDFVVAQGVFHDLEKNSFVSFEVKRRIVDKNGRRFNADMIGVTGNAASSIALRNAVFKGVPKALWNQIYNQAVRTAIGDETTLATRRANALLWFEKAGANREDIFATLEVADESEITLDHLAWLTGVRTAVKDGDMPIERAFVEPEPDKRRQKLDLSTGKTVDEDATPSEVLDGDGIPGEDEPVKEKPKPKPKTKAKKAEPEPEPETDAEPPQDAPEEAKGEEPYPNKKAAMDALNKATSVDQIDEILSAAWSCKSWIDAKGAKNTIGMKADDRRKALEGESDE